MLNVLEDTFMVNQIHDSANLKSIDTESRVKTPGHHKELNQDNVLSAEVNFSNTSKQLEALKASLKDIPEINEARVLYFKAEIESGSYQINSSKIAAHLINMEMA